MESGIYLFLPEAYCISLPFISAFSRKKEKNRDPRLLRAGVAVGKY
jgi:hypothetical protein